MPGFGTDFQDLSVLGQDISTLKSGSRIGGGGSPATGVDITKGRSESVVSFCSFGGREVVFKRSS